MLRVVHSRQDEPARESAFKPTFKYLPHGLCVSACGKCGRAKKYAVQDRRNILTGCRPAFHIRTAISAFGFQFSVALCTTDVAVKQENQLEVGLSRGRSSPWATNYFHSRAIIRIVSRNLVDLLSPLEHDTPRISSSSRRATASKSTSFTVSRFLAMYVPTMGKGHSCLSSPTAA